MVFGHQWLVTCFPLLFFLSPFPQWLIFEVLQQADEFEFLSVIGVQLLLAHSSCDQTEAVFSASPSEPLHPRLFKFSF